MEEVRKEGDSGDIDIIRLVQLRDRWQLKEWIGNWSRGDSLWAENPHVKKRLKLLGQNAGKEGESINESESEEEAEPDDGSDIPDEGAFWIAWEDLLSEFDEVSPLHSIFISTVNTTLL